MSLIFKMLGVQRWLKHLNFNVSVSCDQPIRCIASERPIVMEPCLKAMHRMCDQFLQNQITHIKQHTMDDTPSKLSTQIWTKGLNSIIGTCKIFVVPAINAISGSSFRTSRLLAVDSRDDEYLPIISKN